LARLLLSFPSVRHTGRLTKEKEKKMTRNSIRNALKSLLVSTAVLASAGTVYQTGCGSGLGGYYPTYFSDPLAASQYMSYQNDRFLDAVDAWDEAVLRSGW